ncbi:T9SS type A sorting domain-containing protein, partial [Candidatus Poribacteria bacterium]|nr:T9SS type A sorting domain-containing protein [Candidatus Poribacteria bacterium]
RSTGPHRRLVPAQTRWYPPGSVDSVAFSPDGTTIASESGGDIHLWDVSTGTHIRMLTGDMSQVESIAFSPDGNTLAIGDTDGMIFLWEMSTGKNIRTLTGNTDWVFSIAFSPDGNTIACCYWDNTIFLWDVSTGTHIKTLTGHTRWVYSLSFSPDGTTLASGSSGETFLWDVSTGKNIKTLTGGYSLSFSPDGTTLASGSSGEIRLWDVPTGKNIKTLTGHTTSMGEFSPGGNTLAIASGGDIHLWDVSTSTHITLTGHTNRVYSLSFSPDGYTLASVGGSWKKSPSCLSCVDWEGTIRLWDVSTGTHIKTIPTSSWVRVNSVLFSPDGTTLAGGSGNEIYLWEVSTGMPIKTLTGGHACNINSIAFSPDGNTLVSGNSTRTLFLFDVSTGENIKTLTGHTSHVESVLFSPDGTTLASKGFGYEGIRLWDVPTRTHIRTLSGHTGRVESISFSPDGTTLVSGGGFMDGTIRLFDVSTGENIKTLTAGHRYPEVKSVAFSPDGNTLASGGGSWEKTIHLFDVSTGENIRTLSGHTGDVYSVLFSPDGTTLASESRDGTILLWELNPTRTAVLGDVNKDGVVNITDLTLVASNYGAKGSNPADVNGDGVVNTKDFLLVAVAFENADADAAPTLWRRNTDEILTRENVEKWLNAARQLNLTDPHFQRGIQVLENLLKVLTPKATALLPNYPNPFNPETWIPYQLAKPAEVTLRIYAADGKVVRKLAVGQQPAGMYQNKNRAAYWDGKNAQGEPVSSGVYFYTLTTGDFSATRKMFIRK